MLASTAVTLISIPLSVSASYSMERIRTLYNRNSYIARGLDDLFITSFIEAIKQHNQHYDRSGRSILKKLEKGVKRNKGALINLFSGIDVVHSLGNDEYKREVAKRISERYGLSDLGDYSIQIVSDCLQYYTRSFYAHISNTEFMGIVLEELFECKNTIAEAMKVMNQIEANTAWLSFALFRDALFENYAKIDEDYRKTLVDYDEYIQVNYKDLQLKGFTPLIGGSAVSIKFDTIYVPLNMTNEKTTFQYSFRSSDPIFENVTFYSAPEQVPYIGDVSSSFEEEPLLGCQRCVLLGKPGSGKSTLLKHLAVSISKYRETTPGISKSIIPVYFRVSEYAEAFKTNHTNIHDYLCGRIETRFRSFINTALTCSNAILLVDGLDEVTDKALRNKVTERIEEFISSYPNCQCVITSRIIGYSEARLSARFEHFQLEDFNEDQIMKFSKNWTKAIYPDKDEMEVDAEANDLYRSISRNQSVYRLATNPLLMTIIAMIYFKGSKLPNSRIALYKYSTETFLESWVRLRVDSDSQLKSKDEIIEILCPLAYDIHQEKSDACIEEGELLEKLESYYMRFHSSASRETAKKETKEFLSFLREQAGFFYEVGTSERGENLFSFMHLTFEEYFAGMYIANDFNDGGTLWQATVYQSRWTEILRLAASHLSSQMSRTKTTDFIKAIISLEDQFPELGRKEGLLCQLFADDIIVTDDCKDVFLEEVMNYFASKWGGISLALHREEEAEYRALFRSKIGKEFWSKCLAKLNLIDHQEVCYGILFNILFDDQVFPCDDATNLIIEYIQRAKTPALKYIVNELRNTYCDRNILLCVYQEMFKRIIEFDIYDFGILYRYLLLLYEFGYDGEVYLEVFLDVIATIKDPAQQSRVRNLCLAAVFSTPGFVQDTVGLSYKVIVESVLTSDDRVYMEQYERIMNETPQISGFVHSISALVFCDNEVWKYSFYQTTERDELCFHIARVSAHEQWIISYPSVDTNLLSIFPNQIKKRILTAILENIQLDDTERDRIFSEILVYGDDHHGIWDWVGYITEHFHERTYLGQLALEVYIGRRNPSFYLSRGYILLSEFDREYQYEPSFPLQALIKMARSEPIQKELLGDVYKYALESDGIMQITTLSILDELIDRCDW